MFSGANMVIKKTQEPQELGGRKTHSGKLISDLEKVAIAMVRGHVNYPPELVQTPRWLYFNIYEMSSWSRTMIIPLAIIWAHRPVVKIPDADVFDRLSEGCWQQFPPGSSEEPAGRLLLTRRA